MDKSSDRFHTTDTGDVLYPNSSSFMGPLTLSPTTSEGSDTENGLNIHSGVDEQPKSSKSQHVRSLSDHFNEATKLKLDGTYVPDESKQQKSTDDYNNVPIKYEYGGNESMKSTPTSGQKHRRGLSGGQSNPAVAHRRINSRGNTAFVDRHQSQGLAGKLQHPLAPIRPRLRSRSLSPPSQHSWSAKNSAVGQDWQAYTNAYDHNQLKDPHGIQWMADNTATPYDQGYYESYRANHSAHPPHRNSSKHHDYQYNHAYPAHHIPPEQKASMQQYYYHPYSGRHGSQHEIHDYSNTSNYGFPRYVPTTNNHQPSYNGRQQPDTRPMQHSKSHPDFRTFDKYNFDEAMDHKLDGVALGPRHRTTSSFSSIGSDFKIETDEALFSKEMPPPAHRMSSESPTTLRASPKLFMQSLNDSAMRRPSPPSFHQPQDDTRAPHHDSRKKNMHDIEHTRTVEPHHRHASSVSSGTLHHIFRDIESKGGHTRTCTETFSNSVNDPLFNLPSPSQSTLHALPDAGKNSLNEPKPSVVKSHESVEASEPLQSEEKQLDESSKDSEESVSKKVARTTSKRVRKKCKVEGCTNRIVEGGVCIRHGAKRKKCGYPGCNKHVKKAGMCSAHGPARKKCDFDGCTKVAVKGGRCLSHGASKKLCSVENCKKQAILSGMCKKHHDEQEGDNNALCLPCDNHTTIQLDSGYPREQDEENNMTKKQSGKASKPSHRRGLSVFDDMKTVDSIISSGEIGGLPAVHGSR